jgi:hypothetical protein
MGAAASDFVSFVFFVKFVRNIISPRFLRAEEAISHKGHKEHKEHEKHENAACRISLLFASFSYNPLSQPPDPALAKRASMTFILAMASSIGVGTALSLRMACENRSPCTVYWSQTSRVIS